MFVIVQGEPGRDPGVGGDDQSIATTGHTLTTVPPVGVIESARLTLRPWDASDLVGLRKLAEDPAVMRYIGSGETRAPDRIEGSHARRLDRWHEHGFVERFATSSEVLSPAASADVRAVLADAAAKPARRER